MTGQVYDLAIVGSGIMGVSAAHIAKENKSYRNILVLDRGKIGSGASLYAPGIQIDIGRSPRERDLAKRGSKFWLDIYPNNSWPVGRDCGLYWLTSDVDEFHQLSTTGQKRTVSRAEIDTNLLSLPEVAVPNGVSIIADRCSYSPAKQVVQDLVQRLAVGGICFREEFNATSIVSQSDMLAIQASDGVQIFAKQALVAIGPWLPDSSLLDLMPETPVLRSKKVVSFHLDAKPLPSCPAIGLLDDYAFLIPMIEEGYWLFSFTSQEWDVKPEPEQLDVNDDDVRRATAVLEKWFPKETPSIVSSRVFCDCYPDDAIPFALSANSIARLAFVGGGAGNGFRFGPACAEDALAVLRNRSNQHGVHS